MEQLRLRVLLTLTLGIALGAGGAALAQDEAPEPEAPSPAAQEDQPAGVEEITVTARRREENLQRTPVSIAAFTAAELEERSSFTLDSIGKMTANMKFEKGSSGNRNSAHVFIRGVGQKDNSITNDPGVGIYVDGVYFPRIQGSVIDLLDIERIEVLRGPQGTLFGKNTVGGGHQRRDGQAYGRVRRRGAGARRQLRALRHQSETRLPDPGGSARRPLLVHEFDHRRLHEEPRDGIRLGRRQDAHGPAGAALDADRHRRDQP